MPAKRITSRENLWIRRFREAIDEHRDEIVLEGPKQVNDALRAGWRAIAIASDKENAVKTQPPTQELLVPSPLLASISDAVTPQGVLGLFQRPFASIDQMYSGGKIVVALDGVQDPGNVGTIIRIAAAFESAGIALTEGCADPFSPKAIRASAGTILQVPVCRVSRFELLASATRHSYVVYATAAGGEKTAIPSGKAVIVFGNEGQGVSPEILKAASPLTIAMSKQVESLNVASAAAIVLSRTYEK